MVQYRTKWSFLEPFLIREDAIHLSEISRILDISHTIVRRYLIDFEEIGFLNKQTIGRQTFYSLNKEFLIFIDYLTIAEKEKLISHANSSLLLKELISDLHNIGLPILIFGSFSQKKKHKSNDIDLLIVGKKNKKTKNKLESIEKKINKKLHLIWVNSLEEVNKTLKKEILSKHLIINNPELILKWLH